MLKGLDFYCFSLADVICEQPLNPDISDHYGKLSELYFNVSLSSNCGEKFLNSNKILSRVSMLFRSSSLQWRTVVHWNTFLTIFHHDQVSQGFCKIVGMTFQCIVVLQLREDWPKHAWKQDLRVQHNQYDILILSTQV